MFPAKYRFFLFFLTVSAALLGAGENGGERQNLAAALEREAVAFTERTVEGGGGGYGTAIWAYLPSTEKDIPPPPDKDAPPPDGNISAMMSLLGEYTDLGGEISAGLASSAGIPVELPAGSLVLAIPLYGQQYENGLSWGAGTGLQFIRAVSSQYRKRSVAVVFPDYGEGGGAESEDFLRDIYNALDNPENSTLLFLDFPAAPEELLIYHGSPRHIAPLEILRPLTGRFEKNNIPYRFGNCFNELYKFSLAGRNPAVAFTQSRDIPSLFIGPAKIPPSGGGEDSGARNVLSPAFLGGVLAGYSKEAAAETGVPDTHYSMYYFRGKTFYVSEIRLAALLLFTCGIVIAGFLIFSLFDRLKTLTLLRIGLSYSWVSLLYSLALFLSILAGEALLYTLAAVFRVSLSSLPLDRLYTVIGISLFAGVLFFLAVPAPLLSIIRIKRRGGFYGFSAACFSMVMLLLGISLDITAAPLLSWILACVSLAMIRPRAVPAFIFSLAVAALPAITFTGALGAGELSPVFPLNIPRSALTAALFVLPFLFSLMRAAVFALPYRIRKNPAFLFIKLGLFALSVTSIAIYLRGA
jgi:hypothetical protein